MQHSCILPAVALLQQLLPAVAFLLSCLVQFENLAGFSAVVDRLGEFQEVVDVKLRHTHPRVRRQRAAAATLAAAAAATPAAAHDTASSGAADQTLARPALDSSNQNVAATAVPAAAAAADYDNAACIQIVQVLPWQSQLNSSMDDANGAGQDVLLELDDVSITTPDGALALVQRLSLQVGCRRSCYNASRPARGPDCCSWGMAGCANITNAGADAPAVYELLTSADQLLNCCMLW